MFGSPVEVVMMFKLLHVQGYRLMARTIEIWVVQEQPSSYTEV